ncbi:CaiB/BaiF CoA transferase family protein [Sphingomonas glacialis]|uniref:CoA transferase n=1 Tax=Sphingomonas glacialis TaxID=658225 RepID=A0A502FRW6_9SPHN|nr:CaiB/BaiF CoA-transferase family protein [Sphingomonas glacialis]TPG52139.1 CoA transferase [Sphingomonas glacialis]
MRADAIVRQTASAAPLDGLVVLDMAQFLAGPAAALQLGDLGARVIKIERPGAGDLCRHMYLTDTDIDGQSTLFHAINRNKESLALDLKDQRHVAAVRRLIEQADVVIQNFRPGVIERLGLGYDVIKQINPGIVFASISGYGDGGPWAKLPGQDLLAQARSGVMWLTGNDMSGPMPIGLSIADMLAGHVLAKGILALLVRRGRTGLGGRVETSLLEVLVDFQFELLTTYLNDGGRLPQRAAANGANAYLAAPYGVYATQDGHLALAMTPLAKIEPLLDLPGLAASDGFTDRAAVLKRIALRLAERTTDAWLALLESAGIWCAPVLDWPALLEAESFRALDMLQRIGTRSGTLETTASPLRIDGVRPTSPRGAPGIGQHTQALAQEFGLDLG